MTTEPAMHRLFAWREFASAPKDGTPIFGRRDNGQITVMSYDDKNYRTGAIWRCPWTRRTFRDWGFVAWHQIVPEVF